MFSGIYALTSGAWTNNLSLGDNILRMGQRFRASSYQTAYTGKWHLDGHDYFGTGECPDVWDEKYWYDGKRYLSDLTGGEIYRWRKELNSHQDLQNHDIKPEFTWGHRITDRTIEFRQERESSTPFLLVVAPDEPHHPYTCPPEYAERFKEFKYPFGKEALDTHTRGQTRSPTRMGCSESARWINGCFLSFALLRL